jgi:predicted HAD superfamily phosphohydrolase YqeG
MDTVSQIALSKISDRAIKTGDALMFDIDDTLIYSANGEPIKWVTEFLNTGKQLGYTIVIITARPDEVTSRVATRDQLYKLNISYDLLIFCSPSKKAREKVKTGLNYVMCLGDKLTDLSGGMYFIKLPDYKDSRYY